MLTYRSLKNTYSEIKRSDIFLGDFGNNYDPSYDISE